MNGNIFAHAIEVGHADRLKKVSPNPVKSFCEPQQYQPMDLPRQAVAKFINDSYGSKLRTATK